MVLYFVGHEALVLMAISAGVTQSWGTKLLTQLM